MTAKIVTVEIFEGGKLTMTINEYPQLALRTAPKISEPSQRLLNGLMGLNGEAGEAMISSRSTCFRGIGWTLSTLLKSLAMWLGIWL